VALAVVGGTHAAVAATSSSTPNAHQRSVEQPALLAAARCPLTDLPAPGGMVPAREPLAVNIGNEPNTRPESGLEDADILYDTPTEGGVMRWLAIFQCTNAASIGPVRSVRWLDVRILEQFGHVAYAFAGGIGPDTDAVSDTTFIDDANAFTNPAAYTTDPNRSPPDATYTSSSAIWALFPHTSAPSPIFSYSIAPPSTATPLQRLAIDFSPGTDSVWTWSPSAAAWVHSYGTVPDVDAANTQPITATNVIVEVVHFSIGPYVESIGSTGDIEAVTTGSGPGLVLRNGTATTVTWHRAALTDATTFTDASGATVSLAPGRTAVELVLDTTEARKGAVTLTP